MLLRQLTILLSLLSGAWVPTGLGRPGPHGPLPQPWAAPNQTRTLGQGTLASPVPSFALGSWKAFLDLQNPRRLRTERLQRGQEVATTMSLPLDPQEVAQEVCKAVPFTQVSMSVGEVEGWVSAMAESMSCGTRCGVQPCILYLTISDSKFPPL